MQQSKDWRATKRDMQKAIRLYRNETGKAEIDMHEVALFAINRLGWPRPIPPDPIDILARKFSDAAREEVRHDEATGRPYRANHVIWHEQDGHQIAFWIDIDQERRRPAMVKSLKKRRDAMLDDGVQLSFDAEHWNRINPKEEPIALSFDLHEEIEWRKNTPSDEEKQTG